MRFRGRTEFSSGRILVFSARLRSLFNCVMVARACSIMYQMTSAKLPLAKEMDELDFGLVPVDKILNGDWFQGTSSTDSELCADNPEISTGHFKTRFHSPQPSGGTCPRDARPKDRVSGRTGLRAPKGGAA